MTEEQEEALEADDREEVETPEEPETKPDEEIEAKARDMGWVPKEDFRGDPDNWRPADEFVKRGEEFIPFLRRDRDKFREEVDSLKSKLDEQSSDFKETVESLKRMNDIALEQQRQQLVNQYRVEKEKAVEVGNIDAYRALDTEERKALSDLDEKVKPPEEPKEPADEGKEMPPQVKATIETWISDNPWFKSNKTMMRVAEAYHEELMEEKPGLTLEENLKEVREEVRRRFPEKFGKVKSNGKGSQIEGGSRTGKSSGTSQWSQLPKEVREIAERQIKEGQFSLDAEGNEIEDVAQRRERYAEMYLEG